MAKNRTNEGRPLVDLHMSVMNRDFAADADRVAAVASATRLDSPRYRRVNARCMPAPIASAVPGSPLPPLPAISPPFRWGDLRARRCVGWHDKWVTVEVVSGQLIGGAWPWASIVFRVAGHTGSGIVGRISQRVRPTGVIRQRVIGYARVRVS
jgi:hypothetical protein